MLDIINDLANRIGALERKVRSLTVQTERSGSADGIRVTIYADLPAAGGNTGRKFWVSDALRSGESSGYGTGAEAISDGTSWLRCTDLSALSS